MRRGPALAEVNERLQAEWGLVPVDVAKCFLFLFFYLCPSPVGYSGVRRKDALPCSTPMLLAKHTRRSMQVCNFYLTWGSFSQPCTLILIKWFGFACRLLLMAWFFKGANWPSVDFLLLIGLVGVPAGYRCPRANCQVLEHTWGKLKKHMAKHSGKYVAIIVQKSWVL